ncbi:chromosome partitioning protein ParB [Amylibacter kogurei]|uniref:Chromosome partitioning protein ParB n=1 Tax=Paramylibacter kogurei TaxID=1889778 RepID=A0A2G5KC16_9RHOB|nr:ParB/RepB/Spo0J family partition protein [Amylibacter kogurei]PIB26573.1 chromosome partitioning protein ParB [Amylibacter kogurei]
MSKKPEKRGLGRGLSALMADIEPSPTPNAGESAPRREGEMRIAIEKIHPNPDQPRRDFDPEELENLAASIAERGVIQPIIVREDPLHQGDYQIVAGERRWRASQKAQLHEIPVLLRKMSDREVLEVAIIENVQRADLNAVEEALGYRALMDSFGHTQEQVSTALGKSRSHIANVLRLLNLPADVLTYLRQGKLTAGHARALVGNDDASAMAREIIKKSMSVRQAETLAKNGLKPKNALKLSAPAKDSDTRALETDLSVNLGMKTSIDHKAGGETGSVTISYKNLDELDRLCAILSSQRR